MKGWHTLLVALLFGVGLTLTILAASSSEHEYRVRIQERQEELDDEARVQARLVAGWVAPTWRALLRDDAGSAPALIIDGSGRHSWDPQWPPPLAPSERDRQLYEESIRGGESFEFRHHDDARALDAYSFYLAQIEDPTLRRRLNLRAARTALSHDPAFAIATLRRLIDAPDIGAPDIGATESGIPIPVAAALLMPRSSAVALSSLGELLWEHRSRLSTGTLETLWRELAPDHEGIAREVEERQAIEAAVHTRVGTGVRSDVERLHVARPIDGGGIRATTLTTPWSGNERYDIAVTTRPVSASTEAEASAPIRIDDEVVGWTRVQDREWDAFTAAAARSRNLGRLLVGSLGLILIASGVTLVLAHRRQRQLAQLRARLLTNVSHELKTPVTSLRMFAELIQEDSGNAEANARFAEIMCAESVRLSQLIDNLLDYSRQGRKETLPALQEVDLADVVGTVSRSFSYRAAEQNVEFEANVTDENLATLTDPRAVEQITLNLLDNALKYRSEEDPRIRLRARRHGGRIQISVEDNGVGIGADDRERVFDEFYRARFEDYGVPGSGLGLAISRRLARKLGGEIEVLSTPGEGSVFLLDLPGQSLDNRGVDNRGTDNRGTDKRGTDNDESGTADEEASCTGS